MSDPEVRRGEKKRAATVKHVNLLRDWDCLEATVRTERTAAAFSPRREVERDVAIFE